MIGMLLAGLTVMTMIQLVPGAAAPVDSEYIEQREFTSPISGEVFYAYVLKTDLPVISWDYDRCPHPPVNTLAYTLVIDPVSGYVALPEIFPKAIEWDAQDLQSILGEPKFERSAPAALPWAGAYPWERFENAALLATETGEIAPVVGNFWLMAGWSVRLDVVSGHNEFDARVESLFADLPRREPDAGDLYTIYELLLAEHWQHLHNTGQLLNVSEADFGLAMAWLYRSRGELVGAEHWLRSASLGDPTLAEQDALYAYLMSSIELERHYLREARQWFIQAWNNAEVTVQQEAGSAFLIAELNRRLGNQNAAIFWYDTAMEKNMGMLSVELIQHQRTLASGRGY